MVAFCYCWMEDFCEPNRKSLKRFGLLSFAVLRKKECNKYVHRRRNRDVLQTGFIPKHPKNQLWNYPLCTELSIMYWVTYSRLLFLPSDYSCLPFPLFLSHLLFPPFSIFPACPSFYSANRTSLLPLPIPKRSLSFLSEHAPGAIDGMSGGGGVLDRNRRGVRSTGQLGYGRTPW